MMESWEQDLVALLGIRPELLPTVLAAVLAGVAVLALVELALLVRSAMKRRRLRADKDETDPVLKDLLDTVLRDVPTVLDSQNHPTPAVDTAPLERSVALLEKKGIGDASYYLKLSSVAYSRGDSGQALVYAERALNLAERNQNPINKSAALGSIGVLNKDKGDFDAAFKQLSHALSVSREAGYKAGEAHHMRAIGLMYRQKRESELDTDMALDYFQNALSIHQEINDRLGAAQDLDYLGLTYLDKGDLDLALNCFNDALNVYRETENRRGEARALGNLGLVHQVRGDLDSALRYLNNALMIHEELGNRRGQSQSLGNIGLIYQAKGNLDLALEYHTDALNIDRETGDVASEAQDLGAIGMIYYHKGNYRTALKHLQEARDLFLQSGASADLEMVENYIHELESQL